ncbi:MAG: hypothetical protein CR972_00625 [Candidatus Moraniibacteriota bacterium]|nr:MAG: hypothetical protein CR972_00625 [Candidatus Moranbacteria bacterium]
MVKKICTIYYGDDWHKKVPFNSQNNPTKKSFEEFYTQAQNEFGVIFYRASLKWFNVQKNYFTKAWTFDGKNWIKINKPVSVDVIYDKVKGSRDYDLLGLKKEIMQKTPIYNHPLFRTITNDKLSQYMLFQDCMPKTLLANTYSELKDALKKIPDKKVVIKPLHGSGGFGIYIGDKDGALKEDSFTFPVIIQEFIKSTKGIPGFSQKDEVSDLRLIYVDHELIYALSRIAAKDSLFTNFHQGATAVLVPENKIPQSIIKLSQKIQKTLSVFPHANYSLDFIFDDNAKPFLVEMNTTPGFDLLHIVGDDEIKKKNLSAFINAASKVANK